MPLAYPRRALAAAAAFAAGACLTLAASPAQADQVRDGEWWLAALHVAKAWQSSRGAGVTVAVLDTGVDPSQPDLAGSVISGPDYTASGRVPGGPYWGLDGTAAASLIAGHGHGRGGRDGIIGIAPAARILSVRVTLESSDPLLADPSIAGSLPDAIAHGIRYAVRHHATVVDLPLDPVPTPGSPGAGGSPAERSAVAYALARNVVLVAPAGDGGQGADPVEFPAAYPGVISVGAFDSSFTKAAFSSQQPYVALTAAGAGVVAAQPGSAYATVNSTTAASAVVAGIAALIRAQFPQLTPAQVEQALTQGTIYHRRSGRSDGSGYGTADAAAALTAAARVNEAIPSPAPSSAPTTSAAHAPKPPAVRTTPAPSLTRMIAGDAAVAGGVFVALIGAIFGWAWLQRRRARAARLARVRAAAMAPLTPRRPAPGTAPSGPSPAAGHDRPQAAGAAAPAGAAVPADAAVPAAGDLSARGSSGLARRIPASAAGRAAGGVDPWRARSESPALPGPFPGAAPAMGEPAMLTPFPGDPVGPAPFPEAPLTRPADRDGDGSGGASPVTPGTARPVISGVVLESAADRRQSAGAPATEEEAAAPSGAAPSAATPSVAGPGGPAGGGPGGHGSGIGAMRALGAHRIAAARTPKVSGGPPWEPAAQPDGEMPWARSPGTAGSGADSGPRLPQRRQRSELSVWDVIAQEVWPGGPRSSREEPRAADTADPPQFEAPRPIYIWNPGATTDTFPAIRSADEKG